MRPTLPLAVLLSIISSSPNAEPQDFLNEPILVAKASPDMGRREPTKEELYREWMKHYSPEGINMLELEKKHEDLRELVESLRNNPEKANEGNRFFLNHITFINSIPTHSQFGLENLAYYHLLTKNDLMIHTFYDREHIVLKGHNEILKYALDNHKAILNMGEEEFTQWALNASYFVVKKNVRNTCENDTLSMDSIKKSFADHRGNSRLISHLTICFYSNLARMFAKQDHLGNVKVVYGFSLSPQNDNNQLWLEVNCDKSQFIGTTHPENALFTEAYDPKKRYVKELDVEQRKLLPISKSWFVYDPNTIVRMEKTINILPRELEQARSR